MDGQEILKRVKEGGIKFVGLQFADLLGVVKKVIVPLNELENALIRGAWFDNSSIEGFARIQESDLFLKPDITTYSGYGISAEFKMRVASWEIEKYLDMY